MPAMQRDEVVGVFRERLLKVIERQGVSRSAFAQQIGLDRSTLSQLLSPDNERLARAETIVAIARQGKVSIDWLLGLSQEEGRGADVVGNAMEIEAGSAGKLDETMRGWHAEAAGYKIRYVPTTLPDLLKTEEVIAHEYRDYGERVPQSQYERAEARLAYSRKPETEMEVCSSWQSVEGFARGESIWRDLPAAARRRQIEQMIALCDELYPTFRWFLYDGLRRYASPLTVFGPQRAALYLGNMFFVFNGTDQIRVLTRHFDDLVRAATVQPPDVIGFLDGLIAKHLTPTKGPTKGKSR